MIVNIPPSLYGWGNRNRYPYQCRNNSSYYNQKQLLFPGQAVAAVFCFSES